MHIAIITAPRTVNYISDTILRLQEEWPNSNIHTFEEPGHPLYYGHNQVIRHVNTQRLGCVRNWLTALSALNTWSKDNFMICEDDVDWTRDSGAKVRGFIKSHQFGYVSPYCAQINQPKMRGWQEPRIERHGLCGALSVILSKPAVLHILNSIDAFLDHSLDTMNEQPRHLDYAIGMSLSKFKNYTHNPTLVYHTGEVSTHLVSRSIAGSREPAL